MKLKSRMALLALLVSWVSFAQLHEFGYKRKIEGVASQWHKVLLPKDIYRKTKNNLSDIRILGLTSGNDTIEAPYLLQTAVEKVSDKEANFRIINTAHNGKGYFFTFEIPAEETINKIKLAFKQSNFDWKITLEGSHDQNEWFTIVEHYRILSIKNSQTDFNFTDVDFPASNYRFYRVFIPDHEKPDMTGAKISNHIVTPGTFVNYPAKKISVSENKKSRFTTIDVILPQPVPVSYLKVICKNNYDYYRRISIEYVTDSVRTEKGWIYNYDQFSSGTLNSLDKNEFRCSSTILQKLRITIENQDNQPLTIGTVEIKGYEQSLTARFTETADYFLTYGNDAADAPQYDISQFTDKIPQVLTTLKLGKEETISHKPTIANPSLFENKLWLWLVMGIIIIILGGFTWRMMKNDSD